MGEKELFQDGKKREEELKKEEIVMERIRGMRKQRDRGNTRGNPTRKKMRMDENYKEIEIEYKRQIRNLTVEKRPLPQNL